MVKVLIFTRKEILLFRTGISVCIVTVTAKQLNSQSCNIGKNFQIRTSRAYKPIMFIVIYNHVNTVSKNSKIHDHYLEHTIQSHVQK